MPNGKTDRVSKIQIEFNEKVDSANFIARWQPKLTSADKERQLEDALMLSDPITELTIAMELDYFELVNPDTLAPVGERIDGREVLAVVAARVGATRLIDNQSIQVPSTSDGEQAGSAKREVLHCSARC